MASKTTVLEGNSATSVGKNQGFDYVYNDGAAEGNGAVSDRAKRQRTMLDTVGNLFGKRAAVLPGASRNLDLYQGYPHAMTGLSYAIQGTATVINTDVSEYLATFQDPIKAVFGTSIHREAKVVVTRKYAVGGRALITPEHAPARTVAVQEDAREVMMTRYGGDIEMNLNMFLRPADAQEELKIKVDAQKRELERVLIDKGYEAIMQQGTDLVNAIIRCNPAYSSNTLGATELRRTAERINITNVFGAMSKNKFPIMSLLAASKYASAYTASSQKGSVLIVPHGTPEMLQFTRSEKLVYSIAGPGVLASNGGKPIDMKFDDVYEDPTTSVKIMVHRPMPDFHHGVAFPDVSPGGLTDEVKIGIYYNVEKDEQIMDYGARSLFAPKAGAYVRIMTCMMSSAVLAAPGADTGELLVGYPFTSVSTSSSEQVKIQLRVYLAAVLKRPEAVIVMRNVHFEGLTENFGEDLVEADNKAKDAIEADKEFIDLHDYIGKKDEGGEDAEGFNDAFGQPFDLNADNVILGFREEYDGPRIFYRGSVFDKEGVKIASKTNAGHLGALDCPDKSERLWGTFTYNGMDEKMGK